jgi:hypothetical protein
MSATPTTSVFRGGGIVHFPSGVIPCNGAAETGGPSLRSAGVVSDHGSESLLAGGKRRILRLPSSNPAAFFIGFERENLRQIIRDSFFLAKKFKRERFLPIEKRFQAALVNLSPSRSGLARNERNQDQQLARHTARRRGL